jgi:hypothetical protein
VYGHLRLGRFVRSFLRSTNSGKALALHGVRFFPPALLLRPLTPFSSRRWNDGSNLGTSTSTPLSPISPSEPFLLAGDTDLEEEVHVSDPSGSLYLRPYSRVFLAEKFQVLGVPNVMVYHLGKREMLSTHARVDLMRPEKAEGTWKKWEAGEKVEFSVHGASVRSSC